MKKLILSTTALFAAINIYAQGTVSFANNSASAVSNILTGARVLGAGVFNVALYFLPDGATPTTADFDQAVIANSARTIVGNGPFLGNATTPSGLFNIGARTAATAAPGGFGWFQVRAWETAYGTSYEAAVANRNEVVPGRLALAGTSNIIRVDTGDPTSVPPGTAGSLTGSGLATFTVVPVPEPSVLGLGILGIGALLLLRRRQ